MNNVKIKASLIIFIALFGLFTLIYVISKYLTRGEDKVNFPTYTNIYINSDDVLDKTSERYLSIKKKLENDYNFSKEVLISDYDFNSYNGSILEKMIWNYIFAYELNNKKYLNSIDYNSGNFCMNKDYVIESFKELYNVDISNDIVYLPGYYNYIKTTGKNYCFNFNNVSYDYNNQIKLLVDNISLDNDTVVAKIYVYEFYIDDTESELNYLEELKMAINSSNSLGASGIVKDRLNGNVSYKEIRFNINNDGKFFKYQILSSKNIVW